MMTLAELRRVAKATGRPLDQVCIDYALAGALNPPASPRRGDSDAYGLWQVIKGPGCNAPWRP